MYVRQLLILLCREEEGSTFVMRSLVPIAATTACLISNFFAALLPSDVEARAASVVKPKVVIFSMFDPEAEVWYGIPEFDLLAMNITVPGLSPLFPDVLCTADGEVCQVIVGEAGMS